MEGGAWVKGRVCPDQGCRPPGRTGGSQARQRRGPEHIPRGSVRGLGRLVYSPGDRLVGTSRGVGAPGGDRKGGCREVRWGSAGPTRGEMAQEGASLPPQQPRRGGADEEARLLALGLGWDLFLPAAQPQRQCGTQRAHRPRKAKA